MADADAPQKAQILTEKRYEAVLAALENDVDKVSALLAELHPADVADVVERVPPKMRPQLVDSIPADVLGGVLSELNEGVQEAVLQQLKPSEVAEAVSELETDDVVDIVQHMEDSQAVEAIDLLGQDNQKLLKYAPDTAGGLMQLELVTAKPSWTAAQFIDRMRDATDEDVPSYIGTVFIVNDKNKLIGTVSLGQIVRAAPSKKLKAMMRENPVSIRPDMPEHDVTEIFEKYDIHSCAVVNSRGILLGRVTIHDVLDVVLEEQDKEVMRAAGLNESDDLFAPVSDTTKQRLPWLVLNVFTAILASIVIAIFEGEIQQLVALAVLMPIVASMGGNAGTQTLTVTVRGLATKQITPKNAFYLLRKELLVGGFNGFLLGILLAAVTFFVYQDIMLANVILVATITNHIFAALAGHFIPVVLQKIGKDPAISSGVLVTTVTDVCGFFVFLGLASVILL